MSTANTSWSPSDLLEIGTRQKQVIWMILLGLLGAVIPFATLVTGAISVFFIYKLAVALRSSMAWLYIVLAFIPLVGLLALLQLNGKATKALSSAGLKVGLMGARQSALDRLKRSA